MKGLRRRRSWRPCAKRDCHSRPTRAYTRVSLPRLKNADRKALLLATALASTLLLGTPKPSAHRVPVRQWHDVGVGADQGLQLRRRERGNWRTSILGGKRRNGRGRLGGRLRRETGGS